MDEKKIPTEPDLPVDVSELGELQAVEQECPGVYYFAVKSEDSLDQLPREYYLVMENAPISKEARGYGKPFQNGQGLVFALGEKITAEIKSLSTRYAAISCITDILRMFRTACMNLRSTMLNIIQITLGRIQLLR